MLAPILGSVNCERVLIYLAAREKGYAREVASFFKSSLGPLQKQFQKLEEGGVLYSEVVGRTRLYAFNPRYPFLTELKALLDKALSFYPAEVRNALLMERRRPRRREKPL